MRRVVILGGGFAGLNAATRLGEELEHRRVDVVLVADHGNFLYTPLLSSVATGEVNPEAISIPLSQALPRNVSLVIDHVDAIDTTRRRLHGNSGPVPFDHLVVAPGSRVNWRGYEDEIEGALTCRSARDAVTIKETIVDAILTADRASDEDAARAASTVVVAGGGATGVELAAEINSWAREELLPDCNERTRRVFQVIVVEPQESVLPRMDEELREIVDARLGELGVEVRLGERVVGFDGDEVALENGATLRSQTLIWAAGVRATTLLAESGLQLDPFGRARTLPTLEAVGSRGIYVIGDAAAPPSDPEWNAQVARSQGPLAARNIVADLSGRSKKEWEFEAAGELISLGRSDAAASYRGMTLTGRAARAAYGVVYAALMPSTFKKVNVLRDMLAAKLRSRSTQDIQKLLT